MAGPKMTSMQRVQSLVDYVRELERNGNKEYSSAMMPYLELVAVDDADAPHHHPPRVTFAYTVQPEHCNRLGSLHGGATATLFDFCTTTAMALVPEAAASASASAGTAEEDSDDSDDNDDDGAAARIHLGVSRTLAVTYIRPAPCGAAVLIECEAVHVGRRMASLRGVLRRRSDGAVLATCEHGKVIQQPLLVPAKL